MQNGLYKIKMGVIDFDIKLNHHSIVVQPSIKENTTDNYFHRIHTHNHHELFAVISGEITVVTKEDRTTYKNQIIIIPPNFHHYIVYNDTTIVILKFTPIEVKGHSKIYEKIISVFSDNISIFPLNNTEKFYLQELMNTDKRTSVIDTHPHLIILLLSELVSPLISEENIHIHKKAEHYTTTIDRFIGDHSSEKIYLKDVANELHLCPKQTSRIIKKEYGCNLAKLVHKKRISIAILMLTNTNMSIHEISASIGYESAKDFRVNFKRICGVSPTEYRKNYHI